MAVGGTGVDDGFIVGVADGGTRVSVALGTTLTACTVLVAVGANVGEFVAVADGISVAVGCVVAVAA